ncbi:cobalamin B12-binding domain-containing protein, partial [bacterium]|nr:cobalamin B12-binding domain-containing protein [bacterium]
MPGLGLLTLAGTIPEGWTCSYHELDSADEETLACIADERPTLVALSALTASIEQAYRASDSLRRRGAKTVLGGLHVTALPDEARAHADAVVVGEGEAIFATVLEDALRGELRPSYRAEAPFDLARAPLPRFDLLGKRARPRYTLQTQRGCPLACEFCGASRLLGTFREKPAAIVARELEAICALDQRPVVELADDNTFVNPRWCNEFLDAMAERDVRWFTETDVSIADHPELLARLFESGCRQVLIGFEAASPAGLEGIDARNWKRRRFDGYRDAIRRVQETGVSVNGCFILGKDSDGPEVFDEVAEFVESSGLTEV